MNRLLDVWETLLSFSKYVLSNTFSQNTKYKLLWCSVFTFVQYTWRQGFVAFVHI